MMTAILVIIGAGLGLLIVRGFMLDPVEEIAWRIFLDALFKGNISANDMGEIFKSATFTKFIVGGIIGGIAGGVLSSLFSFKYHLEAKEKPGDSTKLGLSILIIVVTIAAVLAVVVYIDNARKKEHAPVAALPGRLPLEKSPTHLQQETLSEVEKRNAAANQRARNIELGLVDRVAIPNTFALEGEVINVTEPEGSGAYWNFELRTDDGVIYPFGCNSLSELYFKINGRDVSETEGYHRFHTRHRRVTLYIPNSAHEYVIERCRNRGCDDGLCPSVIALQQ